MAIPSRQVNRLTDEFTEVMTLVYNRLRWGAVEQSQFEATIYQMMVAEVEAQIGEELAVIGCSRSADLTNPVILNNLRQTAQRDALSIVETFNRDLAYAIRAIRTETETANRSVFIKRVGDWAAAREGWKNDQIASMAVSGAKNYAVKEFVRRNRVEAKAFVSGPRPAAEEECQTLIDGEPYDANRLPAEFPLHQGCVHGWELRDVEVPMSCEEVWAGE